MNHKELMAKQEAQLKQGEELIASVKETLAEGKKVPRKEEQDA